MSEIRAVCLNCIDGRAQIPAIEAIKESFDAAHVDMITEPGMDGLLADKGRSIEAIIRKINVSIEKNNASVLVVVGHYDCQGNPVDDSTHHHQITSGVDRLKKEFPKMKMLGLWINKEWKGEHI